MDSIYLDHNATTPLLPAARAAMLAIAEGMYGNPASAHHAGRRARRVLEDAREQIASLLDAFPDEVVFTSGATESNNLALFGLAGQAPGHVLASPIEHPSVAEPLRQLVHAGMTVEWLAADATGHVRTEDVVGRLREETRLLTVMLANHETGAIQPVSAIAAAVADRPDLAFHCDAVQAAGKIRVRFHALGVSALSVSAHKLNGPVGIGALLVRRGIRLPARHFGGTQQAGRRPGTESVALAAGFAAALAAAEAEREQRLGHVRRLRERFLTVLRPDAVRIVLNGPAESGVPHTVNLSFPGLQADALLMALDLAGVACTTGSACSSGSLLPSPVLQAMGVPEEVLRSAMRFSFGFQLSEQEVEEAARRVVNVVGRLRQDTTER